MIWWIGGAAYVAGGIIAFLVQTQMPVTPSLAILRSVLWPIAGLVRGRLEPMD